MMLLNEEKKMSTKLKKKRIQSGLLQVEVAAKAGIYPSTLSRFERGWIIPKQSTAEKIADALECGVCELFDTHEESHETRKVNNDN